jgi:RAMP superfamily
MAEIIYKIQFFDYWHTGSGLSGSTYADGIVNKNEDYLPLIPGKTVKGLLREAAKTIQELDNSLISTDFITSVFGDADNEPKCHFSNLTLSEKLAENIITTNNQSALYHVITSTAIDENGQAKEGSLRQLEVTIPLTLYGVISDLPTAKTYEQELKHCFDWVKQLGLNRNRGLGRCQISIVK